MKNEKLEKEIIDEKTGISYTLVGDFYIPNIIVPKEETLILNKYGRMRLDYLKNFKKSEYELLMIQGKLSNHLKEIQEKAVTTLNTIINELKEKSNLTEDMKNTDMLYWVGTMNSIKNQAEEIVLKELIYV